MPEETLNLSAEPSSDSTNPSPGAGAPSPEQQQAPEGQQATPAAEGQPAAPSNSAPDKKDAKTSATARSVVADLFKGSKPGGNPPSDPNKKPQEGQHPGANPSDKKDGTENKNQADDPLHKHPRFQEVIKERNEVKEKLQAAEPELVDYRAIRTYMAENNLTDQEVNTGLQIWAALKNDPAKAAELIAPYLNSLNQFLGVVLPPHLQKQVDDGLMTPEAARNLVMTQNQNLQLQQQQQQLQQRQQQDNQFRAHQQATQAIQGAIAGWEVQAKKSNPDYDKTYPFFEKALRVAIQQQPPRTPQEAVDLVSRTYQETRKNLLAVTPNRQPLTPLPSNTSSSNGHPTAPTNAREAVLQSLSRSRSV